MLRGHVSMHLADGRSFLAGLPTDFRCLLTDTNAASLQNRYLPCCISSPGASMHVQILVPVPDRD